MKTRTGFVSNSSSSSFVIMVSKETYDKAYKEMTPIQKDVAEWLKADGKFGDIETVTIPYNYGNYSTMEDYEVGDGETGLQLTENFDENAFDEERWEVTEEIESILKKNSGGQYFAHSVDM